ncbi:MAG: hypothetical protein ACK5NT_01080 [Pyrinomonadaceae bacterium]
MENIKTNRSSEVGAVSIRLIVFLLVVATGVYAAYNFLPVYYESLSLKDELNAAVMQGMTKVSIQKPEEVVREKIYRELDSRNIPREALVSLKANGSAVTATVSYSKIVHIIPLGIYDYNFVFTYTAVPEGFE